MTALEMPYHGNHLRDILREIEATPFDLERLRWSILEMYAEGRSEELHILNLESEVAESPHGLVLTAARLKRIADGLFQLIDGIVVAFEGEPPENTEDDLRTACYLVIEAIDSGVWRVYTRDAAVAARLFDTFEGAHSVDDVPISAWHG
jgi:hypothetical protein